MAIKDLVIPEVTMPSCEDEDFIEVAPFSIPSPHFFYL
jgi:hypothetical protein